MKAALFDLDGVIVDTEPLYSQFWTDIGLKYVPTVPDFASRIKGKTLTEIFCTYFPNDEKVRNDIRQRLLVFESTMQFPYIEGAIDFVMQLLKNGIATAIVTSSDNKKMTKLYEAHPELKTLFTTVITAEDVVNSKPNPEGYIKAAHRLGFQPEKCVVFEDSHNGLLAARQSGAKVVALTTSHSQMELAQLSDLFIENFSSHQLEHIKHLFNNKFIGRH